MDARSGEAVNVDMAELGLRLCGEYLRVSGCIVANDVQLDLGPVADLIEFTGMRHGQGPLLPRSIAQGRDRLGPLDPCCSRGSDMRSVRPHPSLRPTGAHGTPCASVV